MILVVVLLRVNTVIARKIGDFYSNIMKIKDKRFGLTEDVITGIKSIKYLGWEDIFFEKIMEYRKDEFDCITRIKYLDMCCVMLWGFTSTIIIAVTFMIYNSLGYDLEETNIFSVVDQNLDNFEGRDLPADAAVPTECAPLDYRKHEKLENFVQEDPNLLGTKRAFEGYDWEESSERVGRGLGLRESEVESCGDQRPES
jgi:hypothetical protein